LREESRLRMFRNMVLRRIFGPKRDEVTGEWRKLRNEELNYLYSPPWRYTTHSGCVFYSPLSGFSLLAYEVT
jgi:hypothetical protein